MDVIKPFIGIYNLVDRIKTNNEKCPHILSRLDALQSLVEFIQQKDADQLSEDVIKALEKLNTILESAKEVLSKFNKQHAMTHMVKAGDYKSEFENLNKSLTDAFVTLSGALHVHQEEKLVEQESMLAEQGNTVQELKKKLAKQERKLVEQEDRLAEQEDIVQRMESKIAYQSKGYYCILQ